MLGIVPLNRICVTPRASLGFHQAYYDKSLTFGVKVTSYAGTADLMSYYPETVKELDRPARRADHRHEEGQERPGALGHRRSLPGRVLTPALMPSPNRHGAAALALSAGSAP